MRREHTGLRSAAVFSLCGLFAVLAVGLTAMASGVYRSAAARGDRNDVRRTALSYLVNQTRRADRMGGIRTGFFGGEDALATYEEVEGAVYVTRIYCWEGQLRELYTPVDSQLSLADGIPILEMESLEISAEDGWITYTVTDDQGRTFSASVSPRCGFEEADEL